MNRSSLGQQIRYYRRKIGISQKDLAETIGVSSNTVSGYEKDKREPNIQTLINIAKALNVTSDALLGLKYPQSLTVQDSNELMWLQAYRALKNVGQERALEYISALRDLPRYAKQCRAEPCTAL